MTTTETPEKVIKTVTGTCGKIEESNGFTAFHINVEGWEHPVKLSTKLDPLIELGRAASKDGGAFDWTYKESDGKENPNRPGTFYKNRYLSAVEPAGIAEKPAGSVATPVAAPQVHASGKREYAPDLKDRMIVRQTCLKAASVVVAPRAGSSVHPDYDAALETMKAAQRFETWIYRDIDDPPSDAGRPPLSEHDDGIPY